MTSDPETMIAEVARTVTDERVLDAMRRVPRHRFVPVELREWAYEDRPLPIGGGQTISQPTIVGMMTEALALTGVEHVLEVGTGSGYQAAVLAELAHDVVTVEVIDALREGAARALADLDIHNVTVLPAEGGLGCAERAPYDAILVAAGATEVPDALVAQLRVGGRLVIPVGDRDVQRLLVVTRTATGTTEADLGLCAFVPLVDVPGTAGDAPDARTS